jgi:hypothetical protein
MKDIAQMERVLERMAGKGKPRNKK